MRRSFIVRLHYRSEIIDNPLIFFFFLMMRPPPISTLFPYTTLFRSLAGGILRARTCFSFRPGFPPERRNKRSEEHTSELQSHSDLVCRLLLEKKKRSRMTYGSNR